MVASMRSKAASKARWASVLTVAERVEADMGDLPVWADRPAPGTVQEVDRPRRDDEGARGPAREGRASERREARGPGRHRCGPVDAADATDYILYIHNIMTRIYGFFSCDGPRPPSRPASESRRSGGKTSSWVVVDVGGRIDVGAAGRKDLGWVADERAGLRGWDKPGAALRD